MKTEIDIIIPTCKPKEQLIFLMKEIIDNSTGCFSFTIASNPEFSAAQNRNAGLMLSTAPYIIMIDDDITGFSPGWNEALIQPLQAFYQISIVSARLIRKDGTLAAMMSSKYHVNQDTETVFKVPTACVAFRQTPIRFDENFKGSGFEDDVFCLQMGPEIVIDNRVRLVHLNEMKKQSEYWEHNKKYFEEKYASRII